METLPRCISPAMLTPPPPKVVRWPRVTRLNNLSCPYCGETFSDARAPTKEHVIGRRFVPKGLLDKQWNLILQACEGCNSAKAELEDDISAITMHPSMLGWTGDEHPALRQDALRKARNSIHRSTKKPVADSSQDFNITFRGEGLSIKFSGAAPPQLNPRRAYDLALLQWRALFYWMTYDRSKQLGQWWTATEFLPVSVTRRGDWGNPLNRHFMDTSKEWAQLVLCGTAHGCFKASIKRFQDEPLFAFATEWNEAFRVCGFAGTRELLKPIHQDFPELQFHDMRDHSGNVIARHRAETPLATEDDTMFIVPDDDDQNV